MNGLLRGAVLLLPGLLLAACSSSDGSRGAGPSPAAGSSATAVLARHYLALAEPANHVLDESFDALDDHAGELAEAAGLLRTIAKTERGFDRGLLALALPAPMQAIAARLVRVNEVRADLTSDAARAGTAAELRRDVVDLDAMNVSVEVQVRALRTSLGLPPPDTD
ncbi:hypothetical protein [Jatrophihabitans sp.]|uniref:hypothetical protein n=1 Tax=Jatrophihabitans sp. TaxID=1932789 RepID=UPI0030C6C2E9|nr:hypothetical protein [Jatrophihabitans sp.]